MAFHLAGCLLPTGLPILVGIQSRDATSCDTSVADTKDKSTSSRSLMKPLKMGTRSVVADSGPRMTASSWIELARVLRTWGKQTGGTKPWIQEKANYQGVISAQLLKCRHAM